VYIISNMDRLDTYLKYEIFYFLIYENISKISMLNKQLYIIVNNDIFINRMKNIPSPMIFNMVDNFCKKCNFFYFNKNDGYPIPYLKCGHFN